jgi:opacity protein-like surface antigen
VLGYKDVKVPNWSVAYGQDNTETNFAWAVYGGLAYDVTPGFTIDLSYRYTDLGDAETGRIANNSGGLLIEDITSHDVMLGVRWKLGKQPADARRF